eukprot:symbB.v1.2.041318.t1/scaffold8051.1/size7993/3
MIPAEATPAAKHCAGHLAVVVLAWSALEYCPMSMWHLTSLQRARNKTHALREKVWAGTACRLRTPRPVATQSARPHQMRTRRRR